MTIPFQKGRYTARFARTASDVRACQRLRHLAFLGCDGVEADHFDDTCRHLMVEDGQGRLVAALRLFEARSGAEVLAGYAAQHYDLRKLAKRPEPMIEVGRFCIAPDATDADVLRIAWGALTDYVDARQIGLLFGCTSFQGVDPTRYGRAFARLATRHQGPLDLRPAVGAPEVINLTDVPHHGDDPMPSLLRTYLAMGGWVSDHAVIDRAMNTMHVFTCLDVSSVPPARAAALRALAQAAPLA